jgi:hypothetical protein
MNNNNLNKINLKRVQQKKTKTIHLFSDPIFFLYIYYAHFIAFLFRVYDSIILSFYKSKEIKCILDDTQIYIEKQNKIFLDTFFDMETKTIKNKDKWNENIHSDCYSLDYLNSLRLQENNEIELQWKRRLLYETTPRGNIIMYYDFYKQAFAYVSDQQINYAILNACAMKYVRIYRCIDFFTDTNYLPFDLISPFSLLQEELDKKEKEKSIEKKKELGICFDSSAPFFIKPKKTTISEEPKSILKKKTVSFSEEIEIETEKVRDFCNIFRYLGKVSNLSLLVQIVPIKKHPVLSIPIESFDYIAYKKMQLK